MLFDHHPTYSVLGHGANAKVLRTTSAPDGERTTVVLTAPAAAAARISGDLTQLLTRRHTAAQARRAARPARPAMLRRAVLSAFNTGTQGPGTDCVMDLRDATLPLTDAQRRAVADEVGRLFDGADDVLVNVDLTDECGDLHYSTWANTFLHGAHDEEIADMLDACADSGVLYEGLLAHLRAHDEDIDELADNAWVDVRVDTAEVTAWARAHRPSALALLAARSR